MADTARKLRRFAADMSMGYALSSAQAPLLSTAAVELDQLNALVRGLIDNEPDDLIADGGITVLDQWRKDARRILGLADPEPLDPMRGVEFPFAENH